MEKKHVCGLTDFETAKNFLVSENMLHCMIAWRQMRK
jgi:hypothetical protein